MIDGLHRALGTVNSVRQVDDQVNLVDTGPHSLHGLTSNVTDDARLAALLAGTNVDRRRTKLLPVLVRRLPSRLPTMRTITRLVRHTVVMRPPTRVHSNNVLTTNCSTRFSHLARLRSGVRMALSRVMRHTHRRDRLPDLGMNFGGIDNFCFRLPGVRTGGTPTRFVQQRALGDDRHFVASRLGRIRARCLDTRALTLAHRGRLCRRLLAVLDDCLTRLRRLDTTVTRVSILDG